MSADHQSLLAPLLALNLRLERETSVLDEAELLRLLDIAAHIGLSAGGRQGFLVAVDQDCDHASPNFRWFKERFARFLYVDRVIVAQDARRLGVASRLYAELFETARKAAQPIVGCEVNLVPPNPASLALHARLGFVAEGRGLLPGGKVVRYLTRRCE